MANIFIRQTSEFRYVIDGYENLSNRQGTKFNIFLNALSDVYVERKQTNIVITVIVQDYHAVARILKTIIVFFDKQNVDVKYDEMVLNILETSDVEKKKNQAIIATLKEIQDETDTSKIHLNDFCEFCNKVLKITLRPYQYKAAFLLSTAKGGFDFSVPGAGKTIITYAAYAHMKEKEFLDRVFVIGPGSSYHAWFDEFYTCFGEYPEFENLAEYTTGDCKRYLNASAKNHKEITFINMEKVRLLTKEIIQCISSSKVLLVIDEAHKVKNPNAAITSAVLEITKHANARIVLTGTPMPNGYEDLYSLTKVFSPFEDILPYSYTQLRMMTRNDASEKQSAMIRERLRPYYSRISKKYLLKTKEILSPKYHIVPCCMEEEQRELYDRLTTFFGKISDGVDEDILMALKKAILIRKMQISANPALLQKSIVSSMDELKEEYAEVLKKYNSEIGDLVKVDRELMRDFSTSTIVKTIDRYRKGAILPSKNVKAVEIASELVKQGKKGLVWDIFVTNMDILKLMLEQAVGNTVEMINGSVTGIERRMAIKRFREGGSMVLLANPATLAESISLHKVCQNAIYVNRNFNAAQFIQSKDRIHRINMPVGTTANYFFLINSDSIDSCIDDRLMIKENRMLAILDADDIEIGGCELEDASIMSEQDIEASFLR